MAKRGRPATGRTTRTVRVPIDMDIDVALELYYDFLPTLIHYADVAKDTESSVRSEKLVQLYQHLGEISQRMRDAAQ